MAAAAEDAADLPVTVTVARRVAPGREPEFEAWAARLTAAASGFGGFLGAGLLRPSRLGEDWHVVYRFAGPQQLRVWEESGARAALLAEGAHLMDTVAVRRVSGLETWFSLPGRTAPAPPRWKMFAVSGAVIYTLQLLEYGTLGHLVRDWPLPLRLVLLSFPVTATMTWLVMPRVAVLLAPWLFRGGSRWAGSGRAGRRAA